jgi:hypothetical protein
MAAASQSFFGIGKKVAFKSTAQLPDDVLRSHAEIVRVEYRVDVSKYASPKVSCLVNSQVFASTPSIGAHIPSLQGVAGVPWHMQHSGGTVTEQIFHLRVCNRNKDLLSLTAKEMDEQCVPRA